jgi:hypothetical protein
MYQFVAVRIRRGAAWCVTGHDQTDHGRAPQWPAGPATDDRAELALAEPYLFGEHSQASRRPDPAGSTRSQAPYLSTDVNVTVTLMTYLI